ncbi:MAG: bacteriohemerythrin [Candidatus Pacebacteria bacterium]|nr:bacteriohemerythrin [Candidatus Paceibacterota bacterium]
MSLRFIWNNSYSVNVKIIDEQHVAFLDIVNHIFDLLDTESLLSAEQTEEAQKEKLLAAISELHNYSFFHLTTEEGFFQQFNYENTKEHMEAHDLFRKRVSNYMEASKRPDIDIKVVANDMANFSREWLTNHILTEDKKYTKCFNDHGLNY